MANLGKSAFPLAASLIAKQLWVLQQLLRLVFHTLGFRFGIEANVGSVGIGVASDDGRFCFGVLQLRVALGTDTLKNLITNGTNRRMTRILLKKFVIFGSFVKFVIKILA